MLKFTLHVVSISTFQIIRKIDASSFEEEKNEAEELKKLFEDFLNEINKITLSNGTKTLWAQYMYARLKLVKVSNRINFSISNDRYDFVTTKTN